MAQSQNTNFRKKGNCEYLTESDVKSKQVLPDVLPDVLADVTHT